MNPWMETLYLKRGWLLGLILLACPISKGAGSNEVDVQKIVQRSLEATRTDWQLQSNMVDLERDEDARDGRTTSKTYQVMMLDGSPYHHLVERDGKTLSPQEEAQETVKLREECARRANESSQERAKRMEQYRHSQQRTFELMQEMTKAFDFALTGEETVNGHKVYALRATPRPGYQPPNHETKMLTGMQGCLWIDQTTFQWVRVEAEVTKPVSFGLFIAKVYPGTQFLLEMAPFQPDIWLPQHFRIQVKAAVLFCHKDFTHDETYRGYRAIASPGAKTGLAAEMANSHGDTTSRQVSRVPAP